MRIYALTLFFCRSVSVTLPIFIEYTYLYYLYILDLLSHWNLMLDAECKNFDMYCISLSNSANLKRQRRPFWIQKKEPNTIRTSNINSSILGVWNYGIEYSSIGWEKKHCVLVEIGKSWNEIVAWMICCIDCFHCKL